jgi:protein subunit release factor B
VGRELLFSVTKDDFEFVAFRCGGPGGQKQNKTSSGVRARHKESGAVAESRVHRTQLLNKRAAWKKCVETPAFQSWRRHKVWEMISTREQKNRAKERLNHQMEDSNFLVEVKDESGNWVKA